LGEEAAPKHRVHSIANSKFAERHALVSIAFDFAELHNQLPLI